MASPLLSWLLRLAALCHLTMLPAGQHHAVNKCNKICSSTTSREIPVDRLISYQQNQASCPKRVIILTTIMNRNICADPNAEWVKQAIKYLEGKAASSVQPSGTVLRQIGVAPPPAARGMDTSAVPEPKATGESSSQEAQRALGTSPELPARVAGSWGTRSPTDSKAPDGGSSAGPERTEIFNAADITTTTSWRNSYVYQTGSNIWAEGKVSEAISTQAPSTQAPSTQTPSTQTLPTQTPSTQTLPTQNPTTQAPSTQALPTQTPSTQALPTQTPSTQALATQAPPTISHTAPEDNFGAEGQPVWTNGQDPTPENSLGSTEMGPTSAYMDASMGPGSMPMSPVSEGASSMKPVASSSWTPKAQKMDNLITPVHDPQAATRRQAVGLLAFLGLLFCLGVGMFAYQSLQGCPRNMAGDQVEGLRFVPRSCGSNSYVLVPV